jgi:hypothetical protein
MNSLTKLIASTSALIASVSFAWIALTFTETIPSRHVTVYHELSGSTSGKYPWEMGEKAFRINIDHSGSVDTNHSGSIEVTR